MKNFAKKIQSHFSIGRLTVYGDNAMHFGCTFWTKKFGYVCFRLPLPCNISNKILYGDKIRWQPLYLYCSPNATPWASTFMLGFNKLERVKAKLRRILLGHNFNYDSENEDFNYKIMKKINNI
jgi:hypothetical protein